MVSLGTLKEATGGDAVVAFVEDSILAGTDWNLAKVRRKSIRLEPPHAYWATYRVLLGRGQLHNHEAQPAAASEAAAEAAPDLIGGPGPGLATVAQPAEAEVTEVEAEPDPRWSEERELRLVARGVFDSTQWAGYRDRLQSLYGARACDPLTGLGYPVIYEPSQHAFWFYPVDPNLPNLHLAADPRRMRRLFRARKRDFLDIPARVTDVKIELARYLPEIAAILRYDIETAPASGAKTLYAKVQQGSRSAESHRVMQEIWRLSLRSEGRLRVTRPLGYFPEFGMYLQEAAPGEALGKDRTAPEYLPGVIHAAEALATVHESQIKTRKTLPLAHEIARSERTLDQFAITHPTAYFLLRELLEHLRARLKKLPEDEWLPTHGDYKHDQLLHHEGTYSLIDFDFFALAETSFDIGKFCAYLVPSQPKGWEHSLAAEEARQAFLDRYRELRPDATLGRVPIYEALNLAGRAMTLMWSQTRGWNKAAETMLVIAMERLKSKPV